ncbi:MAG TPA: aldose epimerase [Lysobacter sp.]
MASDAAAAPLAPGVLTTIGSGLLSVDVAPAAGGRIAQIRHDGVELLIGHSATNASMLAWGSYPMVPWAGRIRRGQFDFEGRRHRLPINLGPHAIHGVGFAMPWHLDTATSDAVELSLALPQDARWLFGGVARQRIEVDADRVRMRLSVTAGDRAMPVALGWHPWFRKPGRVEFAPTAWYPRDDEGIATQPVAAPPPGPWDDCFVNTAPVILHCSGRRVRLTSDCRDWVVYDQPAHATCVEPQSGPPDAFNLAPLVLAPGETLQRWFLMEWL